VSGLSGWKFSSSIPCENSKSLKIAFGLGVMMLSKRLSIAKGSCGVGVKVGVSDIDGVGVIVGVRVIVGVVVIDGVSVIVGVCVIVGVGGKKL